MRATIELPPDFRMSDVATPIQCWTQPPSLYSIQMSVSYISITLMQYVGVFVNLLKNLQTNASLQTSAQNGTATNILFWTQ